MGEGPTGGAAAGGQRDIPPGLLQPELPLSLQVELTSHCNLRCAMCPLTTGTSSSSAVRGHIAASTWEKIFPVAMTDCNDFAASERRLGPSFAATLEELRATCAAYGIRLLLTGEERIARDFDEPVRTARPFDSRVGATPPNAGEGTVTRQCAIPWEIPFVDKDGRVFPCCLAASQNVAELGCLGTSTFEAIWTGRPFQRFRRALLDGGPPPKICRRCTLIPLGEHPFRRYAARLRTAAVLADGGRATVEVVNEGRATWARGDGVRVGTTRPRDRSSLIRDPSWLSPNRPGGFREARVLPGGVATFDFAVRHRSRSIEEPFQLVVDGLCWPGHPLHCHGSGRRGRVSSRAAGAALAGCDVSGGRGRRSSRRASAAALPPTQSAAAADDRL